MHLLVYTTFTACKSLKRVKKFQIKAVNRKMYGIVYEKLHQ